MALGPYTPTLILHGGAGSITRAHLPPALYARYEASLARYVVATSELLRGGASAVEAACHAVCLMEDDPLFNCGRGSVFTEEGGIEMEASVMVCSVEEGWQGEGEGEGRVKRGAGVSLVTETRHPVLLAREVLRQGDEEEGWRGLGGMHCQRSGRGVEEWGWGLGGGRALERKGRDWFWTRRRWEEHLRGLEGRGIRVEREAPGVDVDVAAVAAAAATNERSENDACDHDDVPLPSQGTVGCVCMDSWGTLAVATSTGGLTNKKPGRIGDTPTLGAGFWAESWDEEILNPVTIPVPSSLQSTQHGLSNLGPLDLAAEELGNVLTACLPSFSRAPRPLPLNKPTLLPTTETSSPYTSPSPPSTTPHKPSPPPPAPRIRRAVAMSGTGNGDSFLRTSAARTAAAMARFSPTSLHQAVTNIAGYDGELQQSAGERWGQTGEGEGGIIGIEAVGASKRGRLVAEFNCGGMWRAWVDERTGRPRVRVFREEYK